MTDDDHQFSPEDFSDPEFIEALDRILDLLNLMTPQEVKVLYGVARGMTQRQVADDMSLSLNTIGVYVKNIKSKLKLPKYAKLKQVVALNLIVWSEYRILMYSNINLIYFLHSLVGDRVGEVIMPVVVERPKPEKSKQKTKTKTKPKTKQKAKTKPTPQPKKKPKTKSENPR